MITKKNKIKLGDYFIKIFLLFYSLACTFPLILLFMVSITDERMINKHGYSFFPKKFSVMAYDMIFSEGSSVLSSYKVTVIVTVIGTIIAVLITYMAAYSLSNKDVRYRNILSIYFFVTMVFTAGIVPFYLINMYLGIKNNYTALIIPWLVFSPFNLFLMINFLKGIPNSLREAAKIDGAGDFYIAFKIYLYLATPVIAAVSLFYAIQYWNNWFNAIMLVDNRELYPLQYLLMNLVSEVRMMEDLQRLGIASGQDVVLPSDSLKMATSIVTIGPIILLYPFLQKYFIKGLIIGAVKG